MSNLVTNESLEGGILLELCRLARGWVALREVTELVTKDKTGGGVQMQRNSGRTEDWGTWWGRLG